MFGNLITAFQLAIGQHGPYADGVSQLTPPRSYAPAMTLPGSHMPVREADPRSDDGRRTEWLLTNGLGGFAMGTASGIPARRYHHWLNAATRPPVGRVASWLACAEWLILAGPGGEQRIDLSAFAFEGGAVSPAGLSCAESFSCDSACCRWTYRFGPIVVTRELTLAHHANIAIVRYTVDTAGRGARLEVRPLATIRDFHDLRTSDAGLSSTNSQRTAIVTSPLGSLVLDGRNATFRRDEQWWRSFTYAKDAQRGQSHTENAYSPGAFVANITDANPPAIVEIRGRFHAPEGDGLGVGEPPTTTASLPWFADALRADHARLERVVAAAKPADPQDHDIVVSLALAADQFVVVREPDRGVSIIAGYPWFSDWGRDTAICIPGLLIATGRLDDARRVLEAFALQTFCGLVPNCFDNATGQAEYNTVDASLWFVHAACRYIRAAGDPGVLDTRIGAACRQILAAYALGTDFGIHVDAADGLVDAGDITTQLTWMDAKRNGVVFTPRHGKAVEINALWYSAQLEFADVAERVEPSLTRKLRDDASKTGESLRTKFWNAKAGCLYDALVPANEPARPASDVAMGSRRMIPPRPAGAAYRPNDDIRPNQIFAVSLPHSALTPEQQRSVVRVVRDRLLTPVGLRTLDAANPRYIPRFEGDLMARDNAYHNGTVWPWLLGPYCTAVVRAGNGSPESRAEARRAMDGLVRELREGVCCHQVAEIFDAEPPRRADGCVAQAWSVAEMLRVLTDKQ